MRLIDADILKDELREKVLVYEEWADREKSRGRQRLSDNFSGAASGLCQAITILSCQPTIKEHTTTDGSTTTAYGYNLDEICKFAMVCRKEGITEDQLHDFVMNMENAIKVVLEEQQEIIERSFLEITKRKGVPET